MATIADMRPATKGLNLSVKVLDSKIVVTKGPKAECVVGDETGTCIMTAKNEQVELAKPGACLSLTNAKVEMYRGSMRLVVDKWGSMEVLDEAKINPKVENNMSLIEFELIPVEDNA